MTTKEEELHHAVKENNVVKVRKLLNEGVSVNCMMCGMLPVQLAVAEGHEDLALLLMEKRCNVIVRDQHNRTILEEALMKRQCKIVAALLRHNISANELLSFGDSPLCVAIQLYCPQMVKILLDGRASVNSTNLRHESALYIACQEGDTESVGLLIRAGADVNRVHNKCYNFTPLLVAVANDNEDIVKLLLRRKIDLNAQDVDGWTSLWHAYCNCNKEICELLLKAGAKIDVPNSEGKTVIEEANEDEDDDFIQLFSKYEHIIPLPYL